MDNDEGYIRIWVPELREIPNKYMHKLWEAPEHVLQKANIKLSNRYPFPIVDHKKERALYAYNFKKNLIWRRTLWKSKWMSKHNVFI